jgi:hypothetical protein
METNFEEVITDEYLAKSADPESYLSNLYMMRRINFIKLITDRGLRTSVSYRMGISGDSWFSQLMNTNTAFNEKTARRIEASADLPFGTLDKRSW